MKEFDKAKLEILKEFYNINNNSLKSTLNKEQLYHSLHKQYNNDNRYFYKNDIEILFNQLKQSINNWNYKNSFIYTEYVKFFKKIKRRVNQYESKIKYIHQENIEILKQRNKKYFSMITIYPKNIVSISNQIDLIIKFRNIIKECIKEYSRENKQKIAYLAIPEIELNRMNLPIHLHLHFYIYEEINEKLKQKIERRINKLNIRLSINFKQITIDKWTEKNNYSSIKNNVLYKIKSKSRGVYYILFIIIKLFSRHRFITNSRTKMSFTYLKENMKIWICYLGNKGMSYFQFSKKLQDEKWKKIYHKQLEQFAVWIIICVFLLCNVFLYYRIYFLI